MTLYDVHRCDACGFTNRSGGARFRANENHILICPICEAPNPSYIQGPTHDKLMERNESNSEVPDDDDPLG